MFYSIRPPHHDLVVLCGTSGGNGSETSSTITSSDRPAGDACGWKSIATPCLLFDEEDEATPSIPKATTTTTNNNSNNNMKRPLVVEDESSSCCITPSPKKKSKKDTAVVVVVGQQELRPALRSNHNNDNNDKIKKSVRFRPPAAAADDATTSASTPLQGGREGPPPPPPQAEEKEEERVYTSTKIIPRNHDGSFQNKRELWWNLRDLHPSREERRRIFNQLSSITTSTKQPLVAVNPAVGRRRRRLGMTTRTSPHQEYATSVLELWKLCHQQHQHVHPQEENNDTTNASSKENCPPFLVHEDDKEVGESSPLPSSFPAATENSSNQELFVNNKKKMEELALRIARSTLRGCEKIPLSQDDTFTQARCLAKLEVLNLQDKIRVNTATTTSTSSASRSSDGKRAKIAATWRASSKGSKLFAKLLAKADAVVVKTSWEEEENLRQEAKKWIFQDDHSDVVDVVEI